MAGIVHDQGSADHDARAFEAALFGDAPVSPGVGRAPRPTAGRAPGARSDPDRPLPASDYAAAVAARAAAEASAAAAVAARGQLEQFLTRGEPPAPVAGPPEPLVTAAAGPAPARPVGRAPTDDAVPTLVSELAPDAALPTVAPEPPRVAGARRRPSGQPEPTLDPALEEIYFASVALDDPFEGRRPPVRRVGEVAARPPRWRLRLRFRSGAGE